MIWSVQIAGSNNQINQKALNSENISNLPFMEETYDWDAILEEKGEPDESDCSR